MIAAMEFRLYLTITHLGTNRARRSLDGVINDVMRAYIKPLIYLFIYFIDLFCYDEILR